MLKRIFLVVLAGSMVSSCGRDKRSPVEPKEDEKVTLTVEVGGGVSGTPATGRYEYASGTSVPYSFSAGEGYRNVVVESSTSASILPSTGSLVIMDSLTLFANAEVTPVVPSESEPIAEGAAEVVTSSDSASTVNSYLAQAEKVEELYLVHGASRAREFSLAGYRKVYEASSDEMFDRAEGYLAGQMFAAVGRNASAMSAPASARPSVAVIYVNGILTPIDAPARVVQELSGVREEIGLTDNIDLYNFYNGSGRHEQNKTSRCLRRFITLALYMEWWNCGGARDITEAGKQFASILGVLPAEAAEEAKALTKIISRERSDGRSVILVGHSEGALIGRRTLRELGSFDPCVSAISLGDPLDRASWQLPESHLDGFVVSGDVIILSGFNDFQRVETNLSRQASDDFAKIANTSVPYLAFKNTALGGRLHFMADSYMAGVESRELFGNMLKRQTEMHLANSDCRVPTGMHLYAVSGRGTNLGPSDLWIVPPYKNGVDTLVVRLRTSSGATPAITDVARHPNGEMWAVSFNDLYKIHVATGTLEQKAYFTGISPNALAFNHNGDLYVAGTNGRIIGVDTKSMTTFWGGHFGLSYVSAGDMDFSPEGWLYAVARDGTRRNILGLVDYLKDGKVTPVSSESIGAENIFGLAFAGPNLFGMTADPTTGQGLLLSLDRQTGKETVVRKLGFSAFGAAGNRVPDR